MDEDEDGYEIETETVYPEFPFNGWAIAVAAAKFCSGVADAAGDFFDDVTFTLVGASNRAASRVMFHEQTSIELETLPVLEDGNGG
jgi:hypothetical protein